MSVSPPALELLTLVGSGAVVELEASGPVVPDPVVPGPVPGPVVASLEDPDPVLEAVLVG